MGHVIRVCAPFHGCSGDGDLVVDISFFSPTSLNCPNRHGMPPVSAPLSASVQDTPLPRDCDCSAEWVLQSSVPLEWVLAVPFSQILVSSPVTAEFRPNDGTKNG